MQLYQQPTDIKVFGLQVSTFPIGIKESFDLLYNKFGSNRAYYGLSWMDENDNIIYYAMAAVMSPDEEALTGYELLTIEKGYYNTQTIHNWMSKTDSIKDVFHVLTVGMRPNKNHPCIEWYKSDDEMLCMVKAQVV